MNHEIDNPVHQPQPRSPYLVLEHDITSVLLDVTGQRTDGATLSINLTGLMWITCLFFTIIQFLQSWGSFSLFRVE